MAPPEKDEILVELRRMADTLEEIARELADLREAAMFQAESACKYADYFTGRCDHKHHLPDT